MIKRIKKWFVDHFLPMWAKETILVDNRRLVEEVKRLRGELAQREAYIKGLEMGLRSMRRVTIHNGEGKR